jgi:hypothetical protein
MSKIKEGRYCYGDGWSARGACDVDHAEQIPEMGAELQIDRAEFDISARVVVAPSC